MHRCAVVLAKAAKTAIWPNYIDSSSLKTLGVGAVLLIDLIATFLLSDQKAFISTSTLLSVWPIDSWLNTLVREIGLFMKGKK